MKVAFDDIENAFLFTCMGAEYGNEAILCKETGEIFYVSDLGDSDELPDDIDDPDKYIALPDKNELELGKSLVFSFVSEHIPNEINIVERIFSSKGAYSRYKAFLDDKGLLEEWHSYENARQSEALRKWCEQNKIEIDQPESQGSPD